MKEYVCRKCGSKDLFLQDKGTQKGLYCGDCGAWQKWIGAKELPLVERFLNSKQQNKTDALIKELQDLKIKDYSITKSKKNLIIEIKLI